MSPDRPGWPVHVLAESDWSAFVDVDSHAFGSTAPAELVEAERQLHHPGRDIGVREGDRLVGIATAYPFELTVPGGSVRAAGISWVGVLPTHRRRGVLSALMDHQLTSLHDAGEEPVAVLWASEPPIYGRYGYGLASRFTSFTVQRSATALRPDAPTDPGLRLRLVPAAEWQLTAGVYDDVRRRRPGMLARDAGWWQRAVGDLPVMRDGRSELRCVVIEDDGGVRGYARYSTKQSFGEDFGRGVVSVREMLALDPPARAGLYRYLFDLDLMGSTEVWNVPVDDPLQHWLQNPRRARMEPGDALYARLVHVGDALSSRTYSAPVDVVLGVRDQRCPWNAGAWRLVGGAEGGSCARTDDEPDLHLDVRELGAAFLGGTSLVELAEAGWVQGSAESLRATSAAFLASPAPWVPVVF